LPSVAHIIVNVKHKVHYMGQKGSQYSSGGLGKNKSGKPLV